MVSQMYIRSYWPEIQHAKDGLARLEVGPENVEFNDLAVAVADPGEQGAGILPSEWGRSYDSGYWSS